MNSIVEFVQGLPGTNPRLFLGEFGVLSAFALWWTSVVVSLLVGWVIQRRYRHQQLKRWGIPGPAADSFIFGHHWTIQKDPVGAMRKWRKQYGPIFGHYIGDVPFVNVCDPEMVREVFIRSVSVFNERPPMPMTVYPMSQTLLFLPHQKWKLVRSVLAPAFSASKLKFMMSLMNDSSKTLLSVMDEHAAIGEAVCVSDLSQKVTLDVIARCALATKIDCLRNGKDKLLNEVREFLANAEHIAFHLASGIPTIADVLTKLAKYSSAHQMMFGLVDNMKRVLKQRRECGIRIEDMLQLMMDAAENGEGRITDDDIAANAFLFLLGGYETTAITMTMASFLLAKHPEEQEKLYAEISAVWNTDEPLNYETVGKLKRTEAFLLETLRMHPPVITMVSRLGNQDIQVGGYTIPKGTRVQAAVLQIHMDPELWPEPETFSPERFIDTNASSQPHYLPFGVGAKMCMGRRFALLEMKTTLAHILKTFKLKLSSPSQELPPVTLVNVSLCPQGPVPLILERRC